MKKFKFLRSAKIPSDLRRYKMNGLQINSSKVYFSVGMMLMLLVVAFASSSMLDQVQAAPGDAQYVESASIRSGYCSASRSLFHRAILQRLDFALSDGRGNALGLRSGDDPSENGVHAINLQRLDFALSDGRGNALGLRSGNELSKNEAHAMNLQRLDFALSDGRGNALGLRDENISLAYKVLAAICQD
jgi:hypothetical protein